MIIQVSVKRHMSPPARSGPVRLVVKAGLWGVLLGSIAWTATVGFSSGKPASSRPADGVLNWNPRAAAAYLDRRANWWTSWPAADRGQGTFCVSCHTTLPYVIARPALRKILGEPDPTIPENAVFASVTKRVRLWKAIRPYYDASSRGTESVLNALILAERSAGTGRIDDDTRTAFQEMWSLQLLSGAERGSWRWLQFGNEPFEGHDSGYYGAALAAAAVAAAPEQYRSQPDIQPNLRLLSDYLNREFSRQSFMNQVVFLWATLKWPGVLPVERQRAIIEAALNRQQADGGWNLAALSLTPSDWSWPSLKMFFRASLPPLRGKSDGYATGLVTLALEKSDVPRNNPHLQQGLQWLMRSQNRAAGEWPSHSLNTRRDPPRELGNFMGDAATAYASLALSTADQSSEPSH